MDLEKAFLREGKMARQWGDTTYGIVMLLIGIVVFISGFFFEIVEPEALKGNWCLFTTGIFWIVFGIIMLFIVKKERKH